MSNHSVKISPFVEKKISSVVHAIKYQGDGDKFDVHCITSHHLDILQKRLSTILSKSDRIEFVSKPSKINKGKSLEGSWILFKLWSIRVICKNPAIARGVAQELLSLKTEVHFYGVNSNG